MTELEKMVSGEYYDPLDSELIETRHFCKSCLLDFNTLNYTRSKDKMKILEKLFERTGIKVYHVLFVDAYRTWWVQGKSYLCRLIDALNSGLVDEVIFGREVFTRWSKILEETLLD